MNIRSFALENGDESQRAKKALRAEWYECRDHYQVLPGGALDVLITARRRQRNGCVGLPKHNRVFKCKELELFIVNWLNVRLPNYQKVVNVRECWDRNPWCAHVRKSCLAIKTSSTTFTPSLPFVVFHPFDLTTISERIRECQMCGCSEWLSGHYLLNGCLFDVTVDCG